MHTGGFLVLLGTILAGLSLLTGLPNARRSATLYPALLAAGVILIGAGVLVGHTALH